MGRARPGRDRSPSPPLGQLEREEQELVEPQPAMGFTVAALQLSGVGARCWEMELFEGLAQSQQSMLNAQRIGEGVDQGWNRLGDQIRHERAPSPRPPATRVERYLSAEVDRNLGLAGGLFGQLFVFWVEEHQPAGLSGLGDSCEEEASAG